MVVLCCLSDVFFLVSATTGVYSLSLLVALPIWEWLWGVVGRGRGGRRVRCMGTACGGGPVDGRRRTSARFVDVDPPRLAHGMVDKMAQRWPIASPLFSRVGQFPGLPEHAIQLLENEPALMVFQIGRAHV